MNDSWLISINDLILSNSGVDLTFQSFLFHSTSWLFDNVYRICYQYKYILYPISFLNMVMVILQCLKRAKADFDLESTITNVNYEKKMIVTNPRQTFIVGFDFSSEKKKVGINLLFFVFSLSYFLLLPSSILFSPSDSHPFTLHCLTRNSSHFLHSLLSSFSFFLFLSLSDSLCLSLSLSVVFQRESESLYIFLSSSSFPISPTFKGSHAS